MDRRGPMEFEAHDDLLTAVATAAVEEVDLAQFALTRTAVPKAPKLTPEQEAVANHRTGHAIVSAVAGSGKSSTLIERNVRLLRDGCHPERILNLMFNKAAQEHFQQRLKKRIGDVPVMVRTMHAVGNKLMKQLQQMGKLPNSKLASEPQHRRIARLALRTAWAEANGRGAQIPQMVDEEFLRFLTLYKACVVKPVEVFSRYRFPNEFRAFIRGAVYYEQGLRSDGLHTFDDMIWRPVMAMLNEPALKTIATNRIDQLMLDEAQDVSDVQVEMLTILAGTRASVMAVGDVDQCLYSWRGSCAHHILETLPSRFAPSTRYPMTRTFRFGHETALMASHLIHRNTERDDKIVIAADGNPDTRAFYLSPIDNEDSGLVSSLADLHQTGQLHRAAMLVRSYSHSVPYEFELFENGIPFFVYGREPVLHLEEVASQVAALSIAANHWSIDETQIPTFLNALVRFPTMYLNADQVPPLVDAMLAQFEADPSRLHVPLLDLAAQIRSGRQPHNNPEGVLGRLGERADMIELLAAGQLADSSPSDVLSIFDQMIGFQSALDRIARSGDAGAEICANALAFRKVAAKHGNLREFLDTIGPLAASKRESPPPIDHLAVTSIHRAKGLEWARVYVAGLTRGIFPSGQGDNEEDRRLAYVAYTRAMHELILIRPHCHRLDEFDAELDQPVDPTKDQAASDFLFEAEVGASKMLAGMIRDGRGGTLVLRDDTIPTRYLNELGNKTIAIESTGYARPVGLKPIYHGAIVRPGQRVWHPVHGYARVERPISGPAFVIRIERDARSTSDVIIGKDWCFAE
jgi:DNA helicase-2/ATP-dependent DNA helicase PcrA